jgi:hypothetical protein
MDTLRVSKCGNFATEQVADEQVVYDLAYFGDGSKYWRERLEPLPDDVEFEVDEA